MLISFLFYFYFRANFLLFGLRPMWFHATNVILHAAACILFTRVCSVVAGLRRNFAAAAGIMFAVHPIHTEAVSTLKKLIEKYVNGW